MVFLGEIYQQSHPTDAARSRAERQQGRAPAMDLTAVLVEGWQPLWRIQQQPQPRVGSCCAAQAPFSAPKTPAPTRAAVSSLTRKSP